MRVIYGINPVREALKGTSPIEKILISSERSDRVIADIIRDAESAGVPVERAGKALLDRTAGGDNHQGAVAVFSEGFIYSDMDRLISAWKKSGHKAFFLILDSIQDPQNLGSLIRAAVAAGVHGVIIPKDRATAVTPSVVKASAGATAHAMIARETNLVRTIERLKEEQVWVTAIEADAKEEIYSANLQSDIALVIGSEGKGIRRLVREKCDLEASIPVSGGINSLNAAQAGVVAMFEAVRQRRTKGS
ncbi:MAG: 23S rRNA (guanosine(2251)-2'-O)-methyltransferase RlmB [Deltaproteobacteria bacterium]|nr:23S rRNA (guanosine(2251)-2'-O)-methyltransferase RlmB [Deltaproteobacteria bacterium]